MNATEKHKVRVVRECKLVTEVEIDAPLKRIKLSNGLESVTVDSDAVRNLAIAAPFDLSKGDIRILRVEISDPTAEQP